MRIWVWFLITFGVAFMTGFDNTWTRLGGTAMLSAGILLLTTAVYGKGKGDA